MMKLISIVLGIKYAVLSTVLLAGLFSSASIMAEEKRTLPPLRPKAYRNLDLAQQHLDAKNLEKAKKELNTLKLGEARLNGQEKALMYNLFGYIAFTEGKLQEAIENYLKVVEDPQSVSKSMEESALFGISQLYFGLEQYKNSIEYMERWEKLSNKKNTQAKLLIAQSYYQLKDYVSAINPMLAAIEINKSDQKLPDENWLLLLRILYFESDQKVKALNTMIELTQLYPKTEYYLQMSILHGQLGNEKEQMAILESLEESEELTDQPDLLNLASLYVNFEAPINAVKLLDKHLANNNIKKDTSNLRLLANALAMAKEFTRASETFESLFQMNSDDGSFLIEAARMAWMDEDYQRVTELLSEKKSFDDSQRGEAFLLAGMSFFYLKDFNNSRISFTEAKDFKPQSKQARQWISLVNSEQKRQEEIDNYL